MKSFNKVILIGNLASDVNLNTLESGTKVANFRLAVNERFKDRDGKEKDRAVFVSIETWAGLAQTCDRYLKKGRAVLVEGRLRMDEWKTTEGEKRSRLLITAETINFLDSPANVEDE